MNVRNLFIRGFVLAFIASGCGESGLDCFMSTGEIIREERIVASFDSIEVNNNVNVFLIKDTVERIIVEAGQNLLPGIVTEVSNHQLVIGNTNKCNWVRDYKKPINVYVSYRILWKIYYYSSGDVTSSNTISQDSIQVEIWGGCGELKLDVQLKEGNFKLYLGTANILLTGTCNIASMISCDYGLLDARGLAAGYVFITSRSSNNCFVNATRELEATVESIGDIYYTGNPGKVTTIINGSGRVIPF